MAEDRFLLELVNVSRDYGLPGSPGSVAVLHAIDLQVREGECLAIVGPSGSGKTTLLNIMGALDSPTSGAVLLSGKDLTLLGSRELAAIRNADLGFVFQRHHLLDPLTVMENVLVPTLVRQGRPPTGELEERARMLLDRVGLSGRISHRPGQLSHGERQRAALVRALINRPRLLLADEPTGSLDGRTSREMSRLLRDLNSEERITLVVATHSVEVAKEMGRVKELSNGKLVNREEGR